MKKLLVGMLALCSVAAYAESVVVNYPSMDGYALKPTKKLAQKYCESEGKGTLVGFTSERLTYNELQALNIGGTGHGLDRIERYVKSEDDYLASTTFISNKKVDKTKIKVMASVECE